MKYRFEDISIIIPTYNRSDDLRTTLRSFSPQIKNLKDIIIVDQSTDFSTKNFISSLKNPKIKYIHSKIPSLTKARNIGISKASALSKIIIFLDDDITLDKNYFKEILRIFNEKEAIAVGGYFFSGKNNMNNFERFLRRIFFIEHTEKDKCDVLSAYGQIHPTLLTKVIESQWVPGFNMAFRKEVFENDKFDENFSGYSLGEDFEFTYRIYKKYPGELFITPHAKLIHRVSEAERIPTKKISYMNQINHFYINFKNFDNTFKEKMIFFWCLKGIGILRFVNLAIRRRKTDWIKLKLYLLSVLFCFMNLRKIKRGELSDLYLHAIND